MKEKKQGAKFWFLVWGLGIAGQICWNMENQWFNTFVYAKIAKDPDDHFVDGRHIGDRNDHIDIFVWMCVGS